MEKQKKWQRYLIIAVILLTVYNILPTVFYYSKPLTSPINEQQAGLIAESIADRVNALEPQAEQWLHSFCKLIKTSPLSISIDPTQPQFIHVTFKNIDDASRLRSTLPRAGSLVSFVPSQLSVYDMENTGSKTVTIHRRIPIHFEQSELANYYQFSRKFDDKGVPTPLYRGLINDRTLQLGMSLGGPTENAQYAKGLSHPINDLSAQDLLLSLSQNILSFVKVYGENSTITQRYFASFTQIDADNKIEYIQQFIHSLEKLKRTLTEEKAPLAEESRNLKSQGRFLDTLKQQRLEQLISREKTLESVIALIKKNSSTFASGQTPWNFSSLGALLEAPSFNKLQVIPLDGKNPFIDQITIDWEQEKIYLSLHSDVLTFKEHANQTPHTAYLSDQADQLIYNEIARLSRLASETIVPFQGAFEINLNELTHSQSFLAMRLSSIAQAEVNQLKATLETTWNPQHPDLSRENLPIYDYETFLKLSPEKQKLCLVIYAPSLYRTTPPQGLHMNSIYVIAKGMDKIVQRVQEDMSSTQTQQFSKDFNQLRSLLQRHNFVGYSGNSPLLSKDFAQDFLFEGEDYFQTILQATREHFTVHGTKRYAILEFTDCEQRMLTENKIDNRIHEDLLKWRDDYNAAQLNLKGISIFDIPKPTQNVYWKNFTLNCIKYFRGDDRKILHWGLDLSGGKTVQIELRDSSNKLVTNEADIKQGVNELYNRVNKMGVAEVNIRQEGNYITLDFPGSQGLSATDLIKASSMYFHIVNEKFTPNNPALSDVVNRFLQEVWNEAVVTNRKHAEEINAIAWKHLYGDSMDPDIVNPRSDAARTLYANGLRLPHIEETPVSSAFNEIYSTIALFRGNDFTNWQGQTHPLLIVFRNFALEGSNLDTVRASYDASKGNFLSFSIKGSHTTKEGYKMTPRDDLYAWTSQFAKEKITGTPIEAYSSGKGWRMAVVLNGSIISAPTLDSALKDSAMISGSFTQREVNQLEADLKAGSLSFTPFILSEKNVSPELGSEERSRGILSTVLSLGLVIGILIGYYRFAGAIASVTVLFTLLIMWATLQNLNATMTLAGIAGIILTLGMAVDANVLVFERMREEFAHSERIAPAVHAGYRKAFSAILDSNVTTLIAAMILLHFDSGPIKGFAVTLIIGIIASLFTCLFMARFFFTGWVQHPKNKTLNMRNLFKAQRVNFLKHTKLTVVCSAVIILVGTYMLIHERNTLFGMDFKGGYALNIEIQPQSDMAYRSAVEEALLKQGASSQDFLVRELTPSNHIRIFLSRGLEETGHPFYNMPIENDTHGIGFPYESNPKIVWVVHALQQANIQLNAHTLQNLHKNWTAISGQMSDTMRNNALIGLSIALLSILAYITLRFEFKYAISATICLAHDLVFTVGVMAILHALKVPIQIDLNTVTALMTMIGYSLNDTIIVFDRIREDVKLMRKANFTEIINHALNVTLSRTILTSGTTLFILIPLVLLGGSTLLGFALVMGIGVIFGTLSSLFIAAPLMKYFHDKEVAREEKSLLCH